MGRFYICIILVFSFIGGVWLSEIKQSMIFDCTRAINSLLSNRSAPAEKDLLRQVLNDTTTIYYESDSTISEMFEATFPIIREKLESLGWKLGSTRESGNNTLLLGFGVEANVNEINETITIWQWGNQFFYTISEYKPPKTNFTDPNHAVHIILSWRHLNGCNYGKPFKKLQIFKGLESLIFKSPHVRHNSIEYTETQIGCETVNVPETLRFNMVVMAVEFVVSKRFPESYGMFRDYMDSVTKRNACMRYMRSYNHTQTVIRILLQPPTFGTENMSSMPIDIMEKYASLCSRFASKWAVERGISVIIPLSQAAFHGFKTQAEHYVVPIPLETVVPIFDSESTCSDDFNLWHIAPLIASKFTTFYVISKYFLENCQTQVESTVKNSSQQQALMQRATFSQNFSLASIAEWTMSPLTYPEFEKSNALQKLVFNQHVQAVVLTNINTADKPILLLPIVNVSETPILNGYNNVSQDVVCEYGIDQLADVPVDAGDDIIKRFCPYKNASIFNVIQLTIRNPLDEMYMSSQEDIFKDSFYISRIQPHLASAYELALQLQRRHPPFKVTIQFPLKLSLHVDSNPELELGLYCNDKVLKYNELIEAIVNWSHIHNITVILQNIISPTGAKKGWWDPVGTYGFGDRKYSPIFLLRNYPESMSYLGTSPCLTKYEVVLRESIPLGTGMGCRISLEVPGRVEELLSPAELETHLQFALNKFKTVQIHCGQCKNLDMLISSVGKSLSAVAVTQTEIFIDISVKHVRGDSLRDHLLQLVGQLAAGKDMAGGLLMRIQISDWEHLTTAGVEASFESTIGACSKLNVEIGLVIRDCVRVLQNEQELANTKLFRLGFAHFLCVESFHEDVSAQPASRYYKIMTKFLDAQYATKIILKGLFPGKEVHVQFDIQASNTKDYLKGVRDVSQHAELYTMRYFAINGFAYYGASGGKKPTGQATTVAGWWKVANVSDLTNSSNYAELESDYLGIPTWRPQTPPQKLQEKFKLWMILVPIGILSVLFVISLFAVWRISKSRYLTATEEQEFLEGSTDEADDVYLRMGFDRTFEISEIPFYLETDIVLGSGNFGTVYQATLNGKVVAVKIPHEGGCKEAFKSTLQEIKILCYVGSHENVLGFVGAYIKEIRRGFVQIATEFCESGTLLRSLNRTIRGIQGETEEAIQNVIDSYNLERFCLEIACGMEYLQEKKIIHGDLATRNVLLNRSFTCKIADFGLSRKLYEYEMYVKKSQEPLPWRWLAYESIVRMEFSSKSDVWSFGVTLWEIYSLGEVPYPGLSWTPHFADDLKNGLRCEKPRFATNELYGRMMDCWNIEGEERPPFTQLREYFGSFKTFEYTTMDNDGYLSVLEITRHH